MLGNALLLPRRIECADILRLLATGKLSKLPMMNRDSIVRDTSPMLTMLGSPRRCCDGLTRRETLQAGALALLGGLNLPSLLRAEERSARPRKAKSVILLYLLGGAPTQDMFDLKPSAPAEVRGEFKPISTSAAG